MQQMPHHFFIPIELHITAPELRRKKPYLLHLLSEAGLVSSTARLFHVIEKQRTSGGITVPTRRQVAIYGDNPPEQPFCAL